jgi:gliding motility-associated-like protein
MLESFVFYLESRKTRPNRQTERFSSFNVDILFRLCLLALLLNCHNLFGQCDSAYYSITTTTKQQTIEGISISLSSPTNAQSVRSTFESVTGYYLGDENETEEVVFNLSQPVKRIRIFGGALSAVSYGMEFFTLRINGKHHFIKPSELVTPDPSSGRACTLQPNGSIKGDTIVIGTSAGYGSFILTYENPNGIMSFQVKDSISFGPPNGAIFDIQIYTACDNDSTIEIDTVKVFMPNVFTPNGDDKNEVFKPIISGKLKEYNLKVFNRWGEDIFSTTDPNKGWDGENSETGVFYWVCYYQGVDQKLQTRKGWVSLIK